MSTIMTRCRTFGDHVGELEVEAAREAQAPGKPGHAVDAPCPGKDRHPSPAIARRRGFCGLIEIVTTSFPETGRSAVRFEYVGPRSRLALTLAIVFGGRRHRSGDYEPVHVGGKPCRFDWHGGLSGPGLALLKTPGRGVSRALAAPEPANDAAAGASSDERAA